MVVKKKKKVKGLEDYFKPKKKHFDRFRFVFFTFICSLYGARLSDQINSNITKLDILLFSIELAIIFGIIDFLLNIGGEYISERKRIHTVKNLKKSIRETILHGITIGTSYTITNAMKKNF